MFGLSRGYKVAAAFIVAGCILGSAGALLGQGAGPPLITSPTGTEIVPVTSGTLATGMQLNTIKTFVGSGGSAGPVAATTLSASGAVSGTGFTNRFATPGPIGNTTASSGAFTTLSASSTVSGTGFSTYLASPPAIGGGTPAAGTFSTLVATTVNGNTITTGTGTLTLGTGKTLTASNSLTLAGTDTTTMTFPSTSASIARTDAAQTFTGDQTISGMLVSSAGLPTIASGTCGATTNGTVVAGSTNQAGNINIGSAATTTCTIAFSATLGAAPKSCVIQPTNAAAAAVATTIAYVSSITTGHFVITGTALANANYSYICL